MTTNLRPILLALVCGLAYAGAANAAESKALEKLKAADTNHDGQISKAEAQAHPHLAKKFDQIDTNHDGQLSQEELRAWHAAHKHAPKSGKAASGSMQ